MDFGFARPTAHRWLTRPKDDEVPPNLPTWSQWHGSPLQLPLELLAKILQHVPQLQRMRDCALVCQAWKSAAAAATSDVAVYSPTDSKEKALLGWLSKYGVTAETYLQASRWRMQARLSPVRQRPESSCHAWLAALHRLELHDVTMTDLGTFVASIGNVAAADCVVQSGGQQQQFLAALASLTRLAIENSSVPLHGLSACSNLQELVLIRLRQPRAMDAFTADLSQGPAGTAAAIRVDTSTVLGQQLQGLVNLSRLYLLGACWGADALATVSCCTKLQTLELQSCALPLESGLTALPPSITKLYVSGGENEDSDSLPEITPSGAPGLAMLINLKTIVLDRCYISPAVLQGMTQLTSLYCFDGKFIAPTAFTALSVLTSLQVLHVPGMVWPGDPIQLTAADLAALTASSQLGSLCMDYWQVPPNVSGCLFPAGRVLDQLTHLGLGACLLSSPAAVQQLVSCCPNLESLRVAAVTDESEFFPPPDTVVHRTVCLAGLEGLQKLTSLKCSGIELDGLSTVWQQLAQLTGLKELQCRAEDGAHSLSQLLHLTACKLLTAIHISVQHAGDIVEVDCVEPMRSHSSSGQSRKQPPGIWWRFPARAVQDIALACTDYHRELQMDDPAAAAVLRSVLLQAPALCAAAGEFYKQQVRQQQQQLCEQLRELREHSSPGVAGTDVAAHLQQLAATIQADQDHTWTLRQLQDDVLNATVKLLRLAIMDVHVE